MKKGSFSNLNYSLCNSPDNQSKFYGKCNTLHDQFEKKKSLLIIWFSLYAIFHVFAPIILGYVKYGNFNGAIYYYILPFAEIGFYIPCFYLKLILNEPLVVIDYIFLIISISWLIMNIVILFHLIGLYSIIPIFAYIIDLFFLLGIQNDAFIYFNELLTYLFIFKLLISLELISCFVWFKSKEKKRD